jgi:hypothetical protein
MALILEVCDTSADHGGAVVNRVTKAVDYEGGTVVAMLDNQAAAPECEHHK